MDVVRAVVAHAFQVDALEYLQGLDAHRSLAPGPAGVDIDPLIGAVGWGPDAHMEIGQVLHGQEAAVLLMEFHHLLSDLALVEEVAGRLYRGLPALGGVLTLNLDQTHEAAGEVLLHQGFPCLERPAAGVEDLGGGRPMSLAVSLVC